MLRSAPLDVPASATVPLFGDTPAWNKLKRLQEGMRIEAAVPPHNPVHQRYLSDDEAADAMKIRLAPYALWGGTEWEDPNSYQSVVLSKIASLATATNVTDAELVQRYALGCVHETTSGKPNVLTFADDRFERFNSETFPRWFSSDGWGDETAERPPCGSETEDPWFGVTCDVDLDSDEEEAVVTGVELAENLLTGFFPPEITLLASDHPSGAGALTLLDLFDNPFLFNNFDNSWISDLGPDLQYLYLGQTGFVGSFPAPLPEGLLEADFAYAPVDREFTDAVFANATSLEYLNLGGNFLNTSIPFSLATLPSLRFFYATECALTGTLDYLKDMPVIFEHWVDGNPGLGGDLPSWIGTKTSLASLSLTGNGITGSIPTELGLLTGLRQLWLYGNGLEGTVPTELGKLAQLALLEVEGNPGLTGGMPEEVCAKTGFFGALSTVGADCDAVLCECCTCCSLSECQPDLYPPTPAPTSPLVNELVLPSTGLFSTGPPAASP